MANRKLLNTVKRLSTLTLRPRTLSAKQTERTYPTEVKIVEVGPRDGLQNEKEIISTEDKLELIDRLTDAGLKTIETTSFVHPKWVPQMADHVQLMKRLAKTKGVTYPVLVPNIKGLDVAINSNAAEDIAIFAAASESFSKKNINCTIAESLDRFKEVAERANENGYRMRGYVSCVIACPYEGKIDPSAVIKVSEDLLNLGCFEISLGDTIGAGTPGDFRTLLSEMTKSIPSSKLAVHCHDTYGQALANVLASLDYGISVVDSSVSGLGGCPYAPGASGNVATEDLVYMLHGMGVNTGVDLDELIKVSNWISGILGRPPRSKVALAKASI